MLESLELVFAIHIESLRKLLFVLGLSHLVVVERKRFQPERFEKVSELWHLAVALRIEKCRTCDVECLQALVRFNHFSRRNRKSVKLCDSLNDNRSLAEHAF